MSTHLDDLPPQNRRRSKREHMELVMQYSSQNDQHDADSNHDECKGNNWEFNETQCAAEDERTSDDGKNAEAMPPDRTAKQGWPPRKDDITGGLVTDADERDDCRAARRRLWREVAPSFMRANARSCNCETRTAYRRIGDVRKAHAPAVVVNTHQLTERK